MLIVDNNKLCAVRMGGNLAFLCPVDIQPVISHLFIFS